MARNLTLADVARLSDEPTEELGRWWGRGVVGTAGSETFQLRDVERARLVRRLLQTGLSLDAIVQVERDVSLIDRFIDEMYPGGDLPSIDLWDGARRAGVDADLAHRIWDTISRGSGHALLTDDDVEFLRGVALALDSGFPEAALVQMVTVYSDALGRVAEAEARLFHYYVHEPLRAARMSRAQLVDARDEASRPLRALVEPTVLYFHRRAAAEALREDLVLHMVEEVGHVAPPAVAGRLEATIAFADLAGFTSLTEAMGDESAVEVLGRFSAIVRGAAKRTGGRVLKQIGDAFMVVFTDPAKAVAWAVDVNRAARGASQFLPTRIGVHHGPVLYREGDYFGATVNAAARIAGQARAHQIVASADVARATGTAGVTFRPLGTRQLRGLADELELYELATSDDDDRPGAEGDERSVDPVCGMQLAAGDVAARLDIEGGEHVFCSSRCLGLFVAAPDRYAGRPG
jgi:adenylate cyclase